MIKYNCRLLYLSFWVLSFMNVRAIEGQCTYVDPVITVRVFRMFHNNESEYS